MKAKLLVGSAVECMYFNIPDNKFYGGMWSGKILKIEQHSFSNSVVETGYLIEHVGTELPASWMRRKEIRKVLWETDSTVNSKRSDEPPFNLREEVMMWDVYLEEIRPEIFIISDVRRDKGYQSGWIVNATSREVAKTFNRWDSDWFISMKKYKEYQEQQEEINKQQLPLDDTESWTLVDTANYQVEERAADAHLVDNYEND